jgi:hypothetical protein
MCASCSTIRSQSLLDAFVRDVDVVSATFTANRAASTAGPHLLLMSLLLLLFSSARHV